MFAKSLIFPLIAVSFTFVNPCSKSTSTKPSASDKIHNVQVISPQFTSVPQSHEVDGEFDVSERVVITASAMGEIEQIYVNIGDLVTKDDPLVTLSNTQLAEQIDLKRARIKEYQARLKHAQGRLSVTGGEDQPVPVEDTLFLDEDPMDEPVAQKQFGDANQQPQRPVTLKTLAEVLETTIDSLNKQTDVLDRKLLDLTHNAPTGGVVTKKFSTEGNGVKAQDQLIEISKTNPISVTFNLPESVASFIDKHSTVKVSPSDAPEVEGIGTVYYINPDLDTVNKTIQIRAHVSNEDGRIKGGQKAKVRVATRKTARVIVLPKKALFYEDDKKYVFIAYREQAKQVEVKTGDENQDGTIQIFGDLRVDDPIIVDRPIGLKHNAYIKIDVSDDENSDNE